MSVISLVYDFYDVFFKYHLQPIRCAATSGLSVNNGVIACKGYFEKNVKSRRYFVKTIKN